MANVYARSRKGATPFFRDERDNDRWAGVNISLPAFTLNISSVFRWEQLLPSYMFMIFCSFQSFKISL